MGDQSLATSDVRKNILYNNIYTTWAPFRQLEITGQFDFAVQTNSKMVPDTTKPAGMYSGFLQVRHPISEKFSVSARYEFLNDPEGFLTGVNKPTNRGLLTNGFGLSFEYKPVSFGYMRMAYRYLQGYHGSKLFPNNTSDIMQTIIFSTGVRF